MSRWPFTKGLHDLGHGCFAYVQPDGSWGYNNAGLIVDGDETLLVDTLFDLPLTAEMLATMRAKVPAARQIGTLVNTHANGDHTYGNQLVEGARIVASRACRDEMEKRPPEAFINKVRNWQQEGESGRIIWELMGRKFDFDGIVNVLPSETFERRHDLRVGDKHVHLVNVGPAHSRGDTVVFVPKDRTVFTGDIVFSESHPVMWAGPVANWISACDLILASDVETVVPGHGPAGDKRAVQAMRDYLTILRDESRTRYDAGIGWAEAAADIVRTHFTGWLDRERVFVNVNSLYREFSGETRPLAVTKVYEAMAGWYWVNQAR